MNSAKWQKIKSKFSEVLDLPEAERPQSLNECEAEIRQEVEKLLNAYEQAKDFIDKPFLIEQGLAFNEAEDSFVGKQIDDFLILERIGTGGMGAVYAAKRLNSDFRQKVALKIIKRGMDSEAILKRFAQERSILASLKHPNIAVLLDGGISSEGLPYFVMEFADGKPLNQFCIENDVSLTKRLKIFRQICSAVEHAHQNLIIHRDLKPSNIIISDEGIPKLLDFGIAKLLTTEETEITNPHSKIFTPEYASPEQISGKNVTTATDVYSLGVILYELLSGQRPFETYGKSYGEILKHICETEPIPPSTVSISDSKFQLSHFENVTRFKSSETKKPPHRTKPKPETRNPKSLRGDLDKIILKALRKEPSERYSSAKEFSEDILRFLKGLPVLARPQTFQYRSGKYVKRHVVGVTAAALILLSLLGGISVAIWQAFEAKRERNLAEQRLLELRRIAKSLVKDSNDALAKIPKSQELRRSILEKSVAILDDISSSETKDAELFNELADAYEKLAYLRNWNFRETEKSITEYQKALKLRERSLELSDQKVEARNKIISTLGGLMEVYSINSDSEKVLEISQQIRSNCEEIFRLEPENTRNLFGLSIEAERLSDNLKSAEREKESADELKNSFSFIERAIAIRQKNIRTPEKKIELVSLWMQKGNLLEKSKRDNEALKIYRAASELAFKTYQSDSSQTYAFNHTARTHRLIGDIFKRRGDFQKALEEYRFSLDLITSNLNNPKLDQRNLNYGQAIYNLRIGAMLGKLGKRKEAAKKIEEGLEIFRERLKTYVDDASEVIYAPELLEVASNYYIEQGETEKGLKIWDEFQILAEAFEKKTPEDVGILQYLALAYRKKGDVLSGFTDEKNRTRSTNKKNLSLAKMNYQKSLEILRRTFPLSLPNAEVKKIEKNLIERIKNR